MRLVSRRSVLRGLGVGAAAPLFAPVLRDYVREARGQGLPDKRIAFLFGQYSFPPKYINPVVRSPTDFDLNPICAPAEAVKSDMILVRNLGIQQGPGANGGHGQDQGVYMGLGTKFGWTGETWATKVGKDGTIDRFIARKIGVNDRLSSIVFRPGGKPLLPVDYASWDGDDKPYPDYASAVDAYDKIFVGATLPAGAAPVDAKVLLARDNSVLDFVADEIKTLQTRLAGPEREKLDRLTESLRGVERKLAAAAAAPALKCTPPARPTAGSRSQNVEASVDVAAMALACGLTHVATLTLGPDNHDANHADSPSVGTDNTWRLMQAVRVYTKLKALGLSSSSLVLYSDPNGPVHHGGFDEAYFYFMFGSMGGAFKTGRVLELSGRPYMGDFYAAVASAMGVATDTFGDPAKCKGPLSALRA
jgi:hypothetical protein